MSESLHTPKRERRKQHRPGELLEAALDLFVEKGFAATKSEEVAAKAGVSKGTLFLYFPSKEELFKAVVRENVVKTVKEGALEVANFKGSCAELLKTLMLEWWRNQGIRHYQIDQQRGPSLPRFGCLLSGGSDRPCHAFTPRYFGARPRYRGISSLRHGTYFYGGYCAHAVFDHV